MKRLAILLSIMMLSTAALAATPRRAPDYSRDAILKVLYEADREDAAKLRFHVGAIDYNTKTSRFRFSPLMVPVSYAGPNGARLLPNPFVLTGMEFPFGPHQYAATPLDFERSADEEREFRRVMKIVKQRQRVVVNR